MINIRLSGDIRLLNKHLQKLKDFDRVGTNEVLAEAIRSSAKQRFRNQQTPEGKSWKPSLRALISSGVTLTDTARLRNSIKSKADAGGFEVGTNVIYAARHQFGDKKPVTVKAKTSKGLRFKIGGRWVTKKSVKVQIPARPFLGISQDDMDEIKNTLEKIVSGGDKS